MRSQQIKQHYITRICGKTVNAYASRSGICDLQAPFAPSSPETTSTTLPSYHHVILYLHQ